MNRREACHLRHWYEIEGEVAIYYEELIDLIRAVRPAPLAVLEIQTVQDPRCFTVVVLTWMRWTSAPIQTSRS